MVKMVWLLKQPFSCFGLFKTRARLGLGLVGRVGTVTTLGRTALPRWLPHVHACYHVWPAEAASGLAVAWLWPGAVGCWVAASLATAPLQPLATIVRC